MISTMSLDELAAKMLAPEVNRALQNVSVEEDLPVSVSTIDDISRQYLPSEVDRAFPKVNLEHEQVGVAFSVKDLHIDIQGRGLSLIIIVLSLASLIVGAGPLITMLRLILGT